MSKEIADSPLLILIIFTFCSAFQHLVAIQAYMDVFLTLELISSKPCWQPKVPVPMWLSLSASLCHYFHARRNEDIRGRMTQHGWEQQAGAAGIFTDKGRTTRHL